MSVQAISRGADQYIVRFPDGMRDQIKVRAAINRRSMNSEIVLMLESCLQIETASEREALPTV